MAYEIDCSDENLRKILSSIDYNIYIFPMGQHFSGMAIQGILSFNISEHKEFISYIQKLTLYHTCKMSVYRCCRNQSGYSILVLLAFGMQVKCRHTHLVDIDNFCIKLAVCCCGYWLETATSPWTLILWARWLGSDIISTC